MMPQQQQQPVFPPQQTHQPLLPTLPPVPFSPSTNGTPSHATPAPVSTPATPGALPVPSPIKRDPSDNTSDKASPKEETLSKNGPAPVPLEYIASYIKHYLTAKTTMYNIPKGIFSSICKRATQRVLQQYELKAAKKKNVQAKASEPFKPLDVRKFLSKRRTPKVKELVDKYIAQHMDQR